MKVELDAYACLLSSANHDREILRDENRTGCSSRTCSLLSNAIDQLRRERLYHEYHYPPFWWSKLPVVVVCCVLDNEANDIETH